MDAFSYLSVLLSIIIGLAIGPKCCRAIAACYWHAAKGISTRPRYGVMGFIRQAQAASSSNWLRVGGGVPLAR